MKKKVLLAGLAVSALLVTGCEESTRTLNCTIKDESEGTTTTSIMNIDFKGSQAEKITLEINIDFDEEYAAYADAFKQNLESQSADLKEIGYEVEIISGDNSQKLVATGTNETLDESETTGTYENTKKSLEESGYTCK